MRAEQPAVGFISLGCPKALVDSERILTQINADGYAIPIPQRLPEMTFPKLLVPIVAALLLAACGATFAPQDLPHCLRMCFRPVGSRLPKSPARGCLTGFSSFYYLLVKDG